jgi:hypothetical protein
MDRQAAGPDGLAMVSHYIGKVMGRDLEWEGELVKWKRDELWTRKALNGPFAKMSMQMELRFELIGTGRTKVTSTIDYRVPYPLAGWIFDKLYVRQTGSKAGDRVCGRDQEGSYIGQNPDARGPDAEEKSRPSGYYPPKL